MPDQKGRRRRGRERTRTHRQAAEMPPHDDVTGEGAAGARSDADAAAQPASPSRRDAARSVASRCAARRAIPPGATPSPTARATGLMLAVVTAFLAGLLIRDSGGSPGPIVAGILLIALAVVVAVLVVAPARVRTLLRR